MKFIPNAFFRYTSGAETDPKWFARLRIEDPRRVQMSSTIDLPSWGSVIRQFGAWLLVYSIALPPLLYLVFMQSMDVGESALVVVLNVLLLVVGLAVYCTGLVLERLNENNSRHQNIAAWHS